MRFNMLRSRGTGKEKRLSRKPQLEVLEDRTLLSVALGVVFDVGSGPLPEADLRSYSWGVTSKSSSGSGGGGVKIEKPIFQEMTLNLAPSSVEPGLWGHLAAGKLLHSATINVRKFLDGSEKTYLSYTLTDVFISSFTTSYSGDMPTDTIKLDYGKLLTSYSPINGDGSLGQPNKAVYNLETRAQGSAGSLAAPALTALPAVGVTFVDGGVTDPELEVSSYSWGASRATTGGSQATGAGAGKVSIQDLTLTLPSTSAEPGLWGHLATGTMLSSATINVRTLLDGTEATYLTFTLSDVFISSFSTSGDGGDAPVDTITLSFGKIAEWYSQPGIATDVAGTSAAGNTAAYNLETATVGSAGSLSAPALAAVPSAGLTFVDGSVTQPELEVESYSWGVNRTTSQGSTGQGLGSGKLGISDMTVTLAPSSVEPGLWGHLVSGRLMNSATLQLREVLDGVETTYDSFTLSDVTISSFTTSSDGTDAPQDTIQLHFGKVSESTTSAGQAGTQGMANTAEYNLETATSGGAGSLAAPALSSLPTVGVTFVDGGVTENELAVESYSFGASNASALGTGAGAGKASLQVFSLTLAPTSVGPGLWGHLTAGNLLNSATVQVRQLLNGMETTYITYTLTDVFVSSISWAGAGDEAPKETIDFVYGKLGVAYSPINGDGSLGQPNAAAYSVETATSLGAGSLMGPTLSSMPAIGLTLVEGGVTQPELAVDSYSWGATHNVGSGTGLGSGKASLQDLTVTLEPTSVEAGLWGHVTSGKLLSSAALQVRKLLDGMETTYLTFTMTDVFISSVSISDDGSGAPREKIELSFGKLAQTYASINGDGSLGRADAASYNVETATTVNAGTLAAPALPTPPAAGLVFVVHGVTEPELAIESYSWGATHASSLATGSGASKTGPQDMVITLAPSSVEPALWGFLVSGKLLNSATINVRQFLNGMETTYLTYRLTDVFITSLTTSCDGSDRPVDTIHLEFGKMSEAYATVNPDGSLGGANMAGYNWETATSLGIGSLGQAAPTTTLRPLAVVSSSSSGEVTKVLPARKPSISRRTGGTP
jgi:type VI protein secretion system component Hcp